MRRWANRLVLIGLGLALGLGVSVSAQSWSTEILQVLAALGYSTSTATNVVWTKGGLYPVGSYHNWGTVYGSLGYGLRDNGSGTIQAKSFGGSWAAVLTTAYAGTSYLTPTGNGSGLTGLVCATLTDSTAACHTTIGTSGAVLPLLSTANTFSGNQTFTGGVMVGAPTGGMPAAGFINAAGIKINNVPVGTSTSSYWNAGASGIYYSAGPVGIGGLEAAGTALKITGTISVSGTTNALGTITSGVWNGTSVALGYGGTGGNSASTARTNLGLAIGTDVQAYNASLAAIAAGTWTGAASLTTLGTIATGVWHGTAIADAYIASAATWNAAQPGAANLTALAALTYSADGFVRMTGAHTFIVDTTGVVTTDQATGQTIGDTTNRLVKLWATDITVTNPIAGSITGSSAGSAASLKSPATTGVAEITGPGTGTTRVKTVRDANDTLLESAGSYTPTGTWVWTSASVTWPVVPIATNLAGGATGDVPYQTGASTTGFATANATATNKFLRSVSSGVPSFQAVTATDVGLSLVENTALSTWPGTTNITTVGTLAAALNISAAFGTTNLALVLKNSSLASNTNIAGIDLQVVDAIHGLSPVVRLEALNPLSGTNTYGDLLFLVSQASVTPVEVMRLDHTGNLTIPAIKSSSGTRYLCVTTTGLITSSASACSGT
jgi:hypothetical protein